MGGGAEESAQAPLAELRISPRPPGAGTPMVANGARRARPTRPSDWSSPSCWLVGVVAGVVGLITDLYRLSVPALWADEGVTKAMAGRSVSQILATLPHDDVVHGAYYLVVHVAEKAAGSSSVTVLRLPSAIAMTVAAIFTALLARRLAELAGSPYPTITGLFAGVTFALLPGAIYFGCSPRRRPRPT
jgi:hypothetical protein